MVLSAWHYVPSELTAIVLRWKVVTGVVSWARRLSLKAGSKGSLYFAWVGLLGGLHRSMSTWWVVHSQKELGQKWSLQVARLSTHVKVVSVAHVHMTYVGCCTCGVA